jgi:hypothetical protein
MSRLVPFLSSFILPFVLKLLSLEAFLLDPLSSGELFFRLEHAEYRY